MRVVILVIGLLAAQAAHAQGVGPYLGGGLEIAFEEFDTPSGIDADNSLSLDLIGGYRVSQAIAVEAELKVIDEFDIDGALGIFPVSGEIDGWALSGNVKFFPIPPGDAVEPFLLAGLGYLDLDGSVRAGGLRFSGDDSDWMLQIGAGLDFPIGNEWTVEVQAKYHFPQDDLEDFEFWTLGANLLYRF